ncbi:DUF5011 domain-containing protein, partial [candidate division KSB1 bacterium]|nr:DUF5011 domain-containing protein [candidate division KSB1 bacterium]
PGDEVSDMCDPNPILVITGNVDTNVPGNYTITYTATDSVGNTATATRTVRAVDTHVPVISLNGDNPLTIECPLPYEEPGAQVSDLCDPNPVLVITGNVDTNVPGNYTITYTATDASNNSASMQRTVNVVDTTPPVIAINPDIITLWPPNHKYETISVEQAVVSVSDVCDVDLSINDVLIVSVSSDEPEDANGNGDGKTFNDIVIADDCKSVQLRKERQGGGNGRVYTIHFEAVDHSGNPATASYQVQVPHDKKDIAMDEGPAYTVLGNCSIPSALIASNIEENQDGINDVESKLDEKQLNAETNFDKSQDLDETKLLNGYQLYQNHPNPFNPTTEITFALPKAVNVSLVIYNLSGQLVRTLVSGQFPTGVHRVTWNATDDNGIRVASGMYLYVLKAGQYMDKKKLLLMK